MSGYTPFGEDLFGDPIYQQGGGALRDKYVVPPFSILDARQGEWLNRKRAWLSLGIKSEVGRDDDLTFSATTGIVAERMAESGPGTSVFDPVLCELFYRWFCPPGGNVLDPFAGGSVRGVVAGIMGYQYYGIELRREQVVANRAQAAEILDVDMRQPFWRCGDANDYIDTMPKSDLVFTCPPYIDLEVYSDDPKDLSNMSDEQFRGAYGSIIKKTVAAMSDNSFAVFVVGEVRSKKTGMYKGLVPDTINLFLAAGAEYYNELILVTPTGSLPVRTGRTFDATRKVGKGHQNVLVFVKGDPKKATQKITMGDNLELF